MAKFVQIIFLACFIAALIAEIAGCVENGGVCLQGSKSEKTKCCSGLKCQRTWMTVDHDVCYYYCGVPTKKPPRKRR